MDIADIITEFGSYYIDQGQNMARLVKQLYWAGVTENYLTPMITDETVYRTAESEMTTLIQPYQDAWTPKGAVNFKPVEIHLFNQKIDFESNPHKLEATWLGFLSGPQVDPLEWPFIRWLMEVHLVPKMQEDMEINEIYGGLFTAPAAGVPGAAGTAMDGIKTIINRHIDAGRTEPIADLGAIPTDDLDNYEYFEMFDDRIGKKYWMQEMTIGCDMAVARRALRGKGIKYRTNTVGVAIDNKLEYTNLSIVGMPSHMDSNKIWATPKSNACYFRKKTPNMKQFKVESIKRMLTVYTDFWNGVGFLIPEIIWTNAEDLTA
jgi:hypothetical protein